MKKQLFYKLAWFTIILGNALILTVFYWLAFPYKTIVFNNRVFPIVNKVVKQGGSLSYISNYCKYTKKQALVSRTFANDILFSTPSMITSRPEGCHTIVVSLQVPHELPPGVYHLENTYSYDVNPLRTIVVKENTEEFTVVEK